MRRWAIGNRPGDAELDELAALLRAGGVVVLPTDTIYGLHGVATDDRAVARIAAIKGRDDTKPFVVIAASMAQLEAIGVRFSAIARDVLDATWPAPLTAVLELASPIAASRGESTVAARVPALGWLRELLERTGPLASTSANRSGEPPVPAPENLAPRLQNAVDGCVDAGLLDAKPSAIVDFTGDEPRFIREGDFAFTQDLWKRLRKSV